MTVLPLSPRREKQLTPLQLIALTLAHCAQTWADAADEIPQQVWDDLDERGLIVTGRDEIGDGYTQTTRNGDAALFAAISIHARRGVTV